MNLALAALRRANASRHVRYYAPGQEPWALDDWIVALGGEAGEALNIVKKLNRADAGMAGNQAARASLVAQLGDELADVVIYLDILASYNGIGQLGVHVGRQMLSAIRGGTLSAFSEAGGTPSRSTLGSRLLRAIVKLEQLTPGAAEHGGALCDAALCAVDALACVEGIDLSTAVIVKFNATSDKLGFPERLTA